MRTVTKDQLVKIVAAAMAARNQADKSINKFTGAVITTKLPGTTLVTFQKLDGLLTADDYYGPNVVAALKWYLQKSSDPHVPKSDPKYDHIKVTWEPPSLYEPAKPATAAAIPTPKPAAKPATQTAITQKPLVASQAASPVKPSPAPAPAPAPAPGLNLSKAITQVQQAIPKHRKKVPAQPSHGQESVINTNKTDAEDHIAAKATGKKAPKRKPSNAEDIIAAKVTKQNSSALNKIHQKMVKQALQQQATQEHKSINKEDAFKKDTTARLKNIIAILGKRGSAPRQTKTTEERRIIGLVL